MRTQAGQTVKGGGRKGGDGEWAKDRNVNIGYDPRPRNGGSRCDGLIESMADPGVERRGNREPAWDANQYLPSLKLDYLGTIRMIITRAPQVQDCGAAERQFSLCYV